MKKNKILELINKEIDGSISRPEKKRLHDYVQNNPETNLMYDDMLELDKTLNSVTEIDPPQNLTKNIIASINHTKYVKKTKPNWNWDWLYSPRYRVAYSFIGGVLLAVVLLTFLKNPFERDVQSITGTMGARTERIAAIPISAEFVTGNILVTRHNRQYTVEVTLESNEIYEIVISYNPENTQFSSVIPMSPQKTVIERVEDQIRLSGFKNAHHVLTFDRQSDQADFLKVMVVISQEQVVSKKLILE